MNQKREEEILQVKIRRAILALEKAMKLTEEIKEKLYYPSKTEMLEMAKTNQELSLKLLKNL